MFRNEFYNLYAQKYHRAPEGWHWCSLAVLPGQDGKKLIKVEGSVAPLFTKGKREGEHNWSAADPATERTFIVSVDELHAFVKAWEAETGGCSLCMGDGRVVTGAGVSGTFYKACPRGCRPAQPDLSL